MNNAGIHISNLKLERFALGELPAKEKEAITHLMKKDATLAARFESILRSNKEILSLYPPEGMALKIQWKYNRETNGAKKQKKSFIPGILSFAGVLSLFIFIFIMAFSETLFHMVRNDNRIKGASSIKIYRKTEDGAELLKSGTIARKGDRFQIKYFAAGQKYGLIFSMDGNGYITLHFPDSAHGSFLLEQEGEVALYESFKLDNAPGFERFFFVTSKKEFNITEALNAGKRLAKNPEKAKTGKLVLPENLKQQSFILLKERY
jgi:hypothetical protein